MPSHRGELAAGRSVTHTVAPLTADDCRTLDDVPIRATARRRDLDALDLEGALGAIDRKATRR